MPHVDPLTLATRHKVGEVTFSDGDDHIFVDPHLLSTPVLVDIDGDGGQVT